MRNSRLALSAVLMVGLLLPLPLLYAQDASESDAEALLAEIRNTRPPQVDQSRRDDMEYRKQYNEQVKAAMLKRADLARQFHDKFPDHAQAGKVMEDRWQALSMWGQAETVMSETEQIIKEKPQSAVAMSARFARAMITLQKRPSYEQGLKVVEEFIAADPADTRGGDLLLQLANRAADDQATQLELLKRIQQQYPGSRAANAAAGKMRQAEGVGRPFELAFTDAISGKPVSISSLQGKVVVVDFWATWCGPCVAEMPKMKELYSKYRDQGVEFIGISLDAPESEGGLDALKKFVAEKQITWPQYYQGKGWDSDFSKSWGINSIPAIFIVDAQGKLYSTSARGKLETMIPELIARRDGKAAAR